METGDLADAVLVFASGQDFTNATVSTGKTLSASGGGSNSSSSSSSGPASDYGFFPWLEIPCHRAILSARSPFFRSLIQRRLRTASEAAGTTPGSGVVAASGPLRIVLDESVIPRRYARVLMQALYLDTVDMNCIVRPPPVQVPVAPIAQQVTQQQASNIPAASDEVLTSNSVPAVQPRPAPPSLFEEATELYQVYIFARFFKLYTGFCRFSKFYLSVFIVFSKFLLRFAGFPRFISRIYQFSKFYLSSFISFQEKNNRILLDFPVLNFVFICFPICLLNFVGFFHFFFASLLFAGLDR